MLGPFLWLLGTNIAESLFVWHPNAALISPRAAFGHCELMPARSSQIAQIELDMIKSIRGGRQERLP